MLGKSQRELQDYFSLNPDKIKVVLERSKLSSLDDIEKNEIIVPKKISGSQFLALLKKRLFTKNGKVSAALSLFLFTQNILIQPSDLIGDIYLKLIDRMPPNALVIQYSEYSTF